MVEKTDHTGRWPSLYDPFRNIGARLAEWLSPASEASGGKDSYEIAMELPGVSEADVDLTVENGVLTIRGEKKTHEERKGDTWYFSERQYGAFRRSFRLPEDADADKASAKMTDGVLHVSVPKKAPKAPEEGRKIAISKG
ncbi:MAG TPA: glutamyl-tRNA amidotransferase [Rhodobacteraceae bacterium]|jgi:HSP20 family protein|nr:glutamyl-tRNA amidotransferase [Paracoccaceae bacterium]